MLRVNPAFTNEKGSLEQGYQLVVALALMACSLFWTSCGGFSQGSTSSSQQPAAAQTALPAANVGNSYHAALSVGAGRAPYTFDVMRGGLPPGLTLNAATGGISGIPTRAGTFIFTIQVTGESAGRSPEGSNTRVSVVRPYALAVTSSPNPVSVQISPADPSIAAGGKIQFSAAVSDTSSTSNTAVTWSASAGTISSTGLFTAPSSGSAKSITITASVAASAAQASTAVTINTVNPVAVQISPADPSIAAGGKVQFTASVGNTSNPAVTWSASAGTISSTGLFTAPSSGSAKSVTVTASSVVSSAGQASTAVSITTVEPVTVQISPPDPSITAGGKLQFAATVSNTSNTAVTWSASAGTISSTGLFTAPTSGSVKSVTVTATSAAAGAARASTAVTVTSSTPFVINTSSVPSATEATPYSASLTASGGQPPYQWSLASGSLPPGLQLVASTGTLAGSPSQSGTFSFSVRGTDAASHTAQQSLSLLVSNSPSGKTCGPPAYDCSRSDLKIVQLPTPPSVGNLVGANTSVTDPNFGNRIVRITDANTNPAAPTKNITFVTTTSGSADDNLWNIDSTLFTVQDTWADTYVYSFDPNTLQASRLYAANFPATKGLMLSNSGNWSHVNSNLLYTDDGTLLHKYDFTDRSNPPSAQVLYDFTSSPNCLPRGFKPTWSVKGGVNGDDTVFAMAYSNTGDQGTGVYAVVYKVGNGCSVLNTQSGQVKGDWGANGTINIGDRWTIHNVKLSKDGNWLILESTTCTSSNCAQQPYFWQVGTTNVTSCGVGGSCGGHFTEGYSQWVNNDNSPMSNQVIRSFSQAASIRNLTNSFPAGIMPPFDQHQSWNNVDPSDTLPFFAVTWSTTTPFPAPWYNEIIAVAADGSGKTWRFAHSFITTRSQRFSTQWGIGTISQDGRFFIFSSDWMGKLGAESGAADCTIGTNCRGDVFVVELK